MPELTAPAAQQTIQSILTPALMISACGLLLLGLNTRYGTVVNRLRMLNDEKRRRLRDADRDPAEYTDTVRFESIMRQMGSFVVRANYLRRALIFLWIGVISYLLSSFLLGVNLFFQLGIAVLAVWVFMLGIISACIGGIFALLDVSQAHKVLKLETEIY